eukprot:183007-Pelagomonas_calceolata.AAC.3
MRITAWYIWSAAKLASSNPPSPLLSAEPNNPSHDLAIPARLAGTIVSGALYTYAGDNVAQGLAACFWASIAFVICSDSAFLRFQNGKGSVRNQSSSLVTWLAHSSPHRYYDTRNDTLVLQMACAAVVDTFARDDVGGLKLGRLTLVPAPPEQEERLAAKKGKMDVEAAA